MPYVLGVDVGNSHTTAAVCRHDGQDLDVLALDQDVSSVDSVLYLARDDSVLIGRDALARVDAEPDRVVRGFAARIGDEVAALVAGQPYSAEALTAALVGWVVDRAIDAEGEPAERVAVAHPASWGPYRRGLLDSALRQIGLLDVLLLPKPVAAAEGNTVAGQLAAGDALAVYDLGGGTLSCAVVVRTPVGFDLLSRAETEDRIGLHLEDELAAHVLAELELAASDLDPADPTLRFSMAQLRAACRAAKETLSVAPHAIVPAPRLGQRSSVLVTRERFEELISPAVDRTVDTLRQTIRSAGQAAQRVGVVLLVGGSARIPLVAELVGAVPGRVVVDPDPETAVARGAALAGWGPPENEPTVLATPEPVQLPAQREGVDSAPPPRPPVEVAPLGVPRRRTLRRKTVRGKRR
jgi:molecular chaperone DnaK